MCHLLAVRISQDETWLPSDTTIPVPPRRQARENYYFKRRSLGGFIESHAGILKLHGDGKDTVGGTDASGAVVASAPVAATPFPKSLSTTQDMEVEAACPMKP
ncbi:hypothetical protein MRX96_001532 [Rhipicephalus microplus]